MPTDSRVYTLIARWEEARAGGRPVSVEEVCGDAVDLVAPVKELIRQLHGEPDDTHPRPPSGDTASNPSDARSPGPDPAAEVGIPTPGYEVTGRIGNGAMGVVYAARDLQSGGLVALKTLQRVSPTTLARFKREFRTLAGITHPNLVPMFRLVAEGQAWFFTMELVDGVELTTYFDRHPATQAPDAGFWDAVRSCVGQLAVGLNALHAAGVLHRDVKPQNVLVRPDGRVVVVDFGLAAELDPVGHTQTATGSVAGTPAYMAPEQVLAEPLTPAADWYAVGGILYQLLTGRLPFDGSVSEILRDKLGATPPPQSDFREGVPADLKRLCRDLLAREPAERPSGTDILHRLGVGVEGGNTGFRPSDGALVGRDRQLLALSEAMDATRSGSSVLVRVSGPSGTGKSALGRAFLRAASESSVVTLAGRCYEQELVPFKAFDEAVDALARHLVTLPPTEAAAVLPREVGHLVRLFPALARVPAVAAAPAARSVPDLREARRRGLAALREMFTRLADRGPVVLLLDDFQWADADSRLLLDELVRPPEPPGILIVVCYRSEDADTPALASVRQHTPAPPHLNVVDVPVEPLSAEDARALVGRLLDGRTAAEADAVAAESGGNPFFIGELAEAVRAGRGVADGVSLDRAVWERVCGLPADARRYLEVVAVAGRPLSPNIVRNAVGDGEGCQAVEATLRGGRLIRVSGGDRVAPYHDRVREAVLANVPEDERRGHHRRLATVAAGDTNPDPEFLAVHLHAAGDLRAAAGHYSAAADAAAKALAFDQAARLYRLACELGEWTPGELSRLRVGEAEALANAGRGAESAEAFLTAARMEREGIAAEWKRRAAEQYLMAGHLDVGVGTLREVLADAGLPFPTTPLRAMAGYLWGRWKLLLRGLKFSSRPASSVPVAVLRQIDTCWSASTGLAVNDTIRGAYFHMLGLLLSLRAGEPGRVARSLALDATHAASVGETSERRVGGLLNSATELAARVTEQPTLGMVIAAPGMCAFLTGEFRRATDLLGKAVTTLRGSCTSVAWELDTARAWWFLAHVYGGGWGEIAREWPGALQDARNRGDLYAEVYLSTIIPATVRLAEDDPDRAWGEVESAISRWSDSGYHVQHHNALNAKLSIHLHREEAGVAWELIRAKEPVYRRAMLWRIQQVRIDFLQIRARCALAVARQKPEAHAVLRSAARDSRTLQRESAPWGKALGALMRACVASFGDRARCKALFTEAMNQLEVADLGAFAAAARFRLGERTPGREGELLREAALCWFKDQGVRNPMRIIDSYTPVSLPDR